MSAQDKKKMSYVRLGNSGLKVSRIILGLMNYGNKEWMDWVLGEEEAITHIKAAYDAGIQTFDTANIYSNGESERILGKAIKQPNLPRDEVVVMTKIPELTSFGIVGHTPSEIHMGDTSRGDGNGYVNQYGLSRKHIFESVKHSLDRLQLDYIDVLQCHRFDYNTPIEETMQALHDVNHYNLVYREEEREMVPTLKMFRVGMIPWSPLAMGALARPLSETSLRSQTDPFANVHTLGKTRDSNKEIITRVEKIVKSRGTSMAQVALAWNLSKDHTTAPVIGITNLKDLYDTIGAIDVKLTEAEIKQLEEPYLIMRKRGCKEWECSEDHIFYMVAMSKPGGPVFITQILYGLAAPAPER